MSTQIEMNAGPTKHQWLLYGGAIAGILGLLIFVASRNKNAGINASLTSGVASLQQLVLNAQGSISQANAGITGLQSNLGSVPGSTLAQQIVQGNTQIGQGFSALGGQIGTGFTGVGSQINAGVGNLNAAIAGVGGQVSGVSQQVTGVSNQVSGVSSQINTGTTNIQAYLNQIAALFGSSLATQFAQLQASISQSLAGIGMSSPAPAAVGPAVPASSSSGTYSSFQSAPYYPGASYNRYAGQGSPGTYTLPNIVTGGTITVSGSNLQSAIAAAAAATGVTPDQQAAGGTFGLNTNPSVGG